MSPIRRSALAALALTVLTLPSLAIADGAYAGLGVGPGAGLTSGYSKSFDSDGKASAQIFGGYRMGPWGFELSYFGTGLNNLAYTGYNYMLTGTSLGARYNLLLGRSIELYLRLGIDRAKLHVDNRPDGTGGPYHDYGGTGINYGTGVSWQSQPLGTGRIRPRVGGFLDLGVHRVTIARSDTPYEFGGSLKTINLGVISSIDF